MKNSIIAILLLSCAGYGVADTRCGPFLLTPGADDGWIRVNNEKPETQKVTFLKNHDDFENVKIQWMVQRSDAPGLFGMDYVKRNGKAILNVEAVRSNMDQPRLFGSFNCERIN